MNRFSITVALFLCITVLTAQSQSITEMMIESYIKFYDLSTPKHQNQKTINSICPDEPADFYDDWSNEVFGFSRGTKNPGVTEFAYSDSVCLPLKNNIIITSPFGPRILNKKREFHRGIDFLASREYEDTVYSVFCGKVRFTGYFDDFGKVIVIRHYNGSETLYAHLDKILVTNNQEIQVGTPIGIGGNTGRSTGAHLHFEIQYRKNPFNPIINGKFLNKISILRN